MYCSNCGNNVGDGVNFCPKCGKPVRQTDDVKEQESYVHGNSAEYAGMHWYDKGMLYMPLVLSTIAGIIATMLFLFKAIGEHNFRVLWFVPVMAVIFFILYHFDGRNKRKNIYIIHVVINIVAVILYAAYLLGVCEAENDVVYYVYDSIFPGGNTTVGVKLHERFDDFNFYNVQDLSDGGVLVEVEGTYEYNNSTHTVNIGFEYPDIDMFDVNGGSRLVLDIVILDGEVLNDYDINKLFGIIQNSQKQNVGSSSTQSDSQTQSRKYTSVTAKNLEDALNDNALKASNTYKGQYLEITGYLNNIDASGKYISINAGEYDWSLVLIQCYIKNSSQRDIIANMSSGDRIVIRGKCTDVGEIMGYSIDIDEISVK